MGAIRKIGGAFLVSCIWAIIFGIITLSTPGKQYFVNFWSTTLSFSPQLITFLTSLLNIGGIFGFFIVFFVVMISTFIGLLVLIGVLAIIGV